MKILSQLATDQLPLDLGVVVAQEGSVVFVAQAGQGLDHGRAALLSVDQAVGAAHVRSDPA